MKGIRSDVTCLKNTTKFVNLKKTIKSTVGGEENSKESHGDAKENTTMATTTWENTED